MSNSNPEDAALTSEELQAGEEGHESPRDVESTEPAEETSSEPTGPLFADLDLRPEVLEALQGLGYEAPTPIQASCIPHLLEGRDVLGQAQTGTGKTAAFSLPILSRLDLEQRRPQALILTPTRELAIQVAEACRSYAGNLPGFQVLPVYGGQAYGAQLRPLQRGVHVVVGTPGRLLDHLRNGALDLDQLRYLVLDEADEMLRMGFAEEVHNILEYVPSERTTALFSATLPDAVQKVASEYLRDPEEVRMQVGAPAAATIRQRYRIVPRARKLDALTRFFEVEPFEAAIIFVRTKVETVELAEKLQARGHAAADLSGDLPQKQRERTIERLKDGRIDILVATDVAARGLDVDRITHVVNYDLPSDSESYTHRIGRTGRAGREGQAILFLTPRERSMLAAVEKAMETSLEPLELPSVDQVHEARAARFEKRVAEVMAREDLAEPTQRMVEFLHRSEATPESLLGALAFLAQGEKHIRPDDDAPPHREQAERRSQRESGEGTRGRRDAGPEEGMARFYVAVGHFHGVRPGNLVGAITGESDLTSDDIGRIDIHDSFSTVDLNKERAEPNLGALSRTVVRGQELRIRPWRDDGGEGGGGRPRRGRGGFRRGGRGRGGYGGRGGGGRGGYGRRREGDWDRNDRREGGGQRGGNWSDRDGGGRRDYGGGGGGRGGYGGGGDRGYGGGGDRSYGGGGDRGYGGGGGGRYGGGGDRDYGNRGGGGGGRRDDRGYRSDDRRGREERGSDWSDTGRGRRGGDDHGYKGRPQPFPRPRHRDRYFGDDE